MSKSIIVGAPYTFGNTEKRFIAWKHKFIKQNTKAFAEYLHENERAYRLWKAKNYDLLAKEFLDYCYKK